jgi:ATP-dependent DNA helicase RecQ
MEISDPVVPANITQDIHALLKKYWGFDRFRPFQEEIITSVLSAHDTLALLPTGGGKSLCFQVPALQLGGTALVISPLISLMNDQVANLKKRGLSAVALTSAMTMKEIDTALGNAFHGHLQFIYVSPERLQNEVFRQRLAHLPVSLIAVDEAHCISQWGHDFRPSYRQISSLRSYFPAVKVIALTASATAPVISDIQEQLQFSRQRVFRQSFARLNLRYVVQHEENKFERLLKMIRNVGGAGVVYVRNRKKTEELARALSENNVSSQAYHAGLKYDDRQKVQQEWIADKTQVICATNAFGMGIDKPDVRFVAHLDLPESLEAYFQEAGRAGRDGSTAYAVLFYTGADQQRLTDQLRLSFPEPDQMRKVYQAICNYYQVPIGAGEGTVVEFDIERLCASYNLQTSVVYNCVKFLEKENYLSLIDGAFELSKVMITCTKEQLYEFELRNPRLEPLIKTLLRSYGGLFEQYTHISERELGYRVKTGALDLTRQLQQLEKEQILSYIPQSALPRLLFVQSRVDAKYLYFSPENYEQLKKRAAERVKSVIDYSGNNRQCRQGQLLRYFNEPDYKDCGHCDVCIGKKPRDFSKLKNSLLSIFAEGDHTLEQVKRKMSAYRDESWLRAFNEMVEDGLILESGEVYSLGKTARKH